MTWHPEPEPDATAAVVAKLEAAWGVTLVPFPVFSRADYLAVRDGIAWGLVEVKCRSHTPDTYDTLMVDVQKWASVKIAADLLAVHGVLVASFAGDVRAADLSTVRPEGIYWGGRGDRGDPHDFEPCAYLPMDGFVSVP